MAKKEDKQKKLRGELESRTLRGGGRLVLVDEKNQGRKAYQIIFISKGVKNNLLPDPGLREAAEIEREYDRIKYPRDFWKKRIGYFKEYDLRCSDPSIGRLDDSYFDDWPEDLDGDSFLGDDLADPDHFD